MVNQIIPFDVCPGPSGHFPLLLLNTTLFCLLVCLFVWFLGESIQMVIKLNPLITLWHLMWCSMRLCSSHWYTQLLRWVVLTQHFFLHIQQDTKAKVSQFFTHSHSHSSFFFALFLFLIFIHDHNSFFSFLLLFFFFYFFLQLPSSRSWASTTLSQSCTGSMWRWKRPDIQMTSWAHPRTLFSFTWREGATPLSHFHDHSVWMVLVCWCCLKKKRSKLSIRQKILSFKIETNKLIVWSDL